MSVPQPPPPSSALPPSRCRLWRDRRGGWAGRAGWDRLGPAGTGYGAVPRTAPPPRPALGHGRAHSAPWGSGRPRSTSSAARRRALLGGAECDCLCRKRGGCRRCWGRRRRRPWRRSSSSTRGAPSKMTSTMAATWPRPASISAWVGTGDEQDRLPRPPQALRWGVPRPPPGLPLLGRQRGCPAPVALS